MGTLSSKLSTIKSIQRGSVVITSSDVNVTITAVNLSKAVLIVNNSMAATSATAPGGELTTTTNILFKAVAGSTTSKWQVIEYN